MDSIETSSASMQTTGKRQLHSCLTDVGVATKTANKQQRRDPQQQGDVFSCGSGVRQAPGKENLRVEHESSTRVDLKERLADPSCAVGSPQCSRSGLQGLGCSKVFQKLKLVRNAMISLALEPSPLMIEATGDKCEKSSLFPWLGGYDAIALSDLINAEAGDSKCVIPDDYLVRHPEISSVHRTILINWLVEVDREFASGLPAPPHSIGDRLPCHESPRVLFLAVQILDRFLASTKARVTPKNLQLVGIASFVLATKNEVDHSLTPWHSWLLCNGAWTVAQAIAMERAILQALDYVVANPKRPTPMDFIDYFVEATRLGTEDPKLKRTFGQMAHCILEATLLSSSMAVLYKPSVLAASSVLLAQRTCGMPGKWSSELEILSGCCEQQLERPVAALKQLLSDWRETPAGTDSGNQVHNKYATLTHGRVAQKLYNLSSEDETE